MQKFCFSQNTSDPQKPVSAVRLFVPLFLGIFLSLFADSMLYAILPREEIAMQFGISTAFSGVVLGTNRLFRIFFNQRIGNLYDRMPRRPLMLLSAIICILSTLCYIISYNGVLLIIGRMVWGVSWGFLWIGAATMTLDISNNRNRGQISSISMLTQCIASAATSFSIGMVFDWLGLRHGLWFSFFMGILLLLLWFFFLPETYHLREISANNPEADTMDTAARAVSCYTQRQDILKYSILLGIPMFAINFVYYGVVYSTGILWLGSFFPDGATFLSHYFPLATLTGYFGSIRILVGAVGAPLAGTISDKVHSRKMVLFASMLICLIGTLMLGLRIFALSFAGTIIAGIAVGAVPTLVYAWVGDKIDPSSKSSSIGIISTLSDLGSGIGPILAILIIPAIGVSTTYGIMSIFFVAGLIATLKIQ